MSNEQNIKPLAYLSPCERAMRADDEHKRAVQRGLDDIQIY